MKKNINSAKKLNTFLKNAMILTVLLISNLNRFEHEQLDHDCINVTINELRKADNVITDEWESVPTRFVKMTRAKEHKAVDNVSVSQAPK